MIVDVKVLRVCLLLIWFLLSVRKRGVQRVLAGPARRQRCRCAGFLPGLRRRHNAGHERPRRANTAGSRLGPSGPPCLPVGPFATTLEENDIS